MSTNTFAPLNDQRLCVLKAAVDRIIPADDFPSGWEAGVGDFISGLLGKIPRYAAVYEAGLDGLDAEALCLYGVGFADLDEEKQDALLKLVQEGDVKTPWKTNPYEFFKILVDQTMEGYYADPGNGGNRDGAAWRMVGFEVTA